MELWWQLLKLHPVFIKGKYKRNILQCVMPICSVKTIISCHRVIPISQLHHVVHMVDQTILFSLPWALIMSLIHSQILNSHESSPWCHQSPMKTVKWCHGLKWLGLSWLLKVDFKQQHYQLFILNRNLIVCLKQLLSGLMSQVILLFQNFH